MNTQQTPSVALIAPDRGFTFLRTRTTRTTRTTRLAGTLALTVILLPLTWAAGEPAINDPALNANAPVARPTAPTPAPAPAKLNEKNTGAPIDIADMLAPLLARHNLPGMAAAVIKDGQVIALGASGVRKRGDTTPVTTSDLWHLGSCTKSMTATLCAVLVDRAELSWDQTLAATFPFALDHMHAAYKPVTLEQLLTNRGGFPGELKEGGLWSKLWRFKGTDTAARRLILDTITSRAPNTKPGAFEYSNAGFSVAGLMAEQMTDATWEDLMQREVFAPLGITSAGFGAPGVVASPDAKPGEKTVVDQPRGHVLPLGTPMDPGLSADNPSAIGPAGRVHMTIGDWAKYIAAHLDGEAMLRNPVAAPANDIAPAPGVAIEPGGARTLSRPGELLKPESWRKLHAAAPTIAPKDNTYAMGWSVTQRPWAKGKNPGDIGLALTHNGSNTMWYCVAWIAPERNLGVIVCVNQAGTGAKAADEAASALIGRFAKRRDGE